MNSLITFLNTTGKSFVDFAGPMLIQSSLLIIVLFALDLLLRKKVRAVFRYCIWMLILVKLILPTTLSSPTSPGYWFTDKLPDIITQKPSIPSYSPPVLPHIEPAAENTPPVTAVAPSPPAGTIHAPAANIPAESIAALSPPTIASLSWKGFAFLSWLAAVTAMALLLIQRMFFVKGLLAQSKDPSDSMLNTFEQCRNQMKTHGPIFLKLSPVTASPSVCGLFRPTILIPQNLPSKLNDEDLKSILLHELAHIKRGDLWINLAQALLQIAYFYNPFLWLANAIIRRIREQAVDEMVLVAMGARAENYPQTLLNISGLTFSRPALSLRLIGVVESKKALTGRIKHILTRPFPKSAKLSFLGLITIIIAAAVLLPMAKAASKPPEFIIKGTVTDAETGRPVVGAKVGDVEKYADGQQWTTTDSNGNYEYKTWYEEHDVKVQADGYKRQNKGFRTKLFGNEKEKVIDFALEKGQSERLELSAIPPEYIGHWKGQAKIIVNWTKQKNLPIDIEVNSDGNVEGRIGDAKLIDGRLVKKSWVYTEVFQHENPYRIEGDLQGEIIKSENIQRDSVTMSIRVENGKIDGGLGTSGTKTGNKESMILSAMDVSLIRIDENNTKTSTGSKINNLKATLPDGVTVELIGVCEHPSEGKQWWRPDGNSLPQAPYESREGQPIKNRDKKTNRLVEFAISFVGEQLPYTDVCYKVPGAPRTSGGGDVHSTPEGVIKSIACEISKSRDTAEVRLGVASGQWKTITEYDGSRGGFVGPDDIVFSNPIETKRGTTIAVRGEWAWQGARRIIAIDKSGNIHTGGWRGRSTGLKTLATTDFYDLKPEQIQKYQLQFRPYEWIEFKNVSLKPNFKTDVQVVAEGVGEADYSSVTVKEGVGFDNLIFGCTGDFIKSKLGKPDKELHNEKDWWLNYRKTYGLGFWVNPQENYLIEIRLNPGFKGKLSSGISMSSAKKDVFDVYGEPLTEIATSEFDERYDNQVLLKKQRFIGRPKISKIYYNQHGLLFWFEDDKINQIVVSRKETAGQIEVKKSTVKKPLPQPPVKVTFKKDMSIRDALRTLGIAYQKNIIPSDNVKGRVPVTELYDLSFEEILQAILGTHKYIIDGKFIRVYTEEEFNALRQESSNKPDWYKPVLEKRDPVLYYSFDKDEGQIVTDQSGEKHHGYVHKAWFEANGKTGGAISFDGSGGYISVPDIHLNEFTFSAWVRTPLTGGAANNQRIFTLDDGVHYYALQGNVGGALSVIADGEEINEYDWQFAANSWTHLVLTHKRGTFKLYKNGMLTESGYIDSSSVAGTLCIGGTDRHRGGFWQGSIDEVVLYNRTLNPKIVKKFLGMCDFGLNTSIIFC